MKKKLVKGMLIGMGILAVGIVINFIPAFSLKTKGMQELRGEWITVYYEKEDTAAKDVFGYADLATADIANELGFSERPNVNVYIYDF